MNRKLKLICSTWVISLAILLIQSSVISGVIARGSIRLRFPVSEADAYPIYSYVDHDRPMQKETTANTIVMFNGRTYNNCPDDPTVWTAGGQSGPFCYDGHEGMDWPIRNKPVYAAAEGTVEVSMAQPVYGEYVIIKHAGGYRTHYAHLSQRDVSVGDEVEAGQQIGVSGNTGTGANNAYHLHFHVTHNGTTNYTDPFGWQGTGSDPLIDYPNTGEGEAAVCLWADSGLCNEVLVEDGDIDTSNVKRFARFGDGWLTTKSNSWTGHYTNSGDGSTYAYWIPYLSGGLYEVFVFIPEFANKTRVTYIIHDKDDSYGMSINQAEHNNKWVSLGAYDFGTGANNYVMLSNESESGKVVVFDSVKFRQFRSYLPVITRAPDAPTPQPNSCYVGRVLVEDGYENGDPFGEGTGTAGPWERYAFDGFPDLPKKAGLGDFNNPVPRPSGDDGLKFGGEDNEDLGEDRNDLDQLAFVAVFIPAGTKKVKTTFDVLLVSQQDPATSGQYDHLYWGLQTTLDTGNLNARYDCNEDVATQSPHRICWNKTWISPTTIEITMNEVWPPVENGSAYAGFWVDVSRYGPSWFYIDNFKMVITECE